MGGTQMKRFGLCKECLKKQGVAQKNLLSRKMWVNQQNIYEVSDNRVQSKFLKCVACKSAKSARLGFKEYKPSSVGHVWDVLAYYKEESSFVSNRLEELVSWLKRDAKHIESQGRDYWINEGILYFKKEDDGITIRFNDAIIDVHKLFTLLSN
jgi:hypothetical protein